MDLTTGVFDVDFYHEDSDNDVGRSPRANRAGGDDEHIVIEVEDASDGGIRGGDSGDSGGGLSQYW